MLLLRINGAKPEDTDSSTHISLHTCLFTSCTKSLWLSATLPSFLVYKYRSYPRAITSSDTQLVKAMIDCSPTLNEQVITYCSKIFFTEEDIAKGREKRKMTKHFGVTTMQA